MSWEIVFVITLLVIALASFIVEKFPTDQVAVAVFAILVVAGLMPFSRRLPRIEELLTVFANPAPMTIAAMFILSAALEKTGAIEIMARVLNRLGRLGYKRFLLIMILSVALVSAFINNTPVVIVFMPVVLKLSRSIGVNASKLLIPLSYASIFGGTCTLVGTSTNLLASGILQHSGQRPLTMFEISSVGLPLLAVGALYLAFGGKKLLPERVSLTAMLSADERKEFITEAVVPMGSRLAGRSVNESRLIQEHTVRIVEIIRDGVALEEVDPQKIVLEEGDRLVLSTRPSGVAYARSIQGLGLKDAKGVGLETVSAHEGLIVEGVVAPRSVLIGQQIGETNFRQRYRVVLLALHRRGVNLRENIEAVTLEAGDLLLMMGTDTAIEQLRRSDDIYLLDKPVVPSRSMRRKIPIVVGTVAAVILAASLNLVPIVAGALIGIAVVFFSGCLEPKEGYASIEWSILVLIYGMLALGLAMQTTGTADLLAGMVIRFSQMGIFPAAIQPHVALALIYLSTMVMTETLSNNATVVVMTPIALSLGLSLGVDPRPFVIATCIAASASFSTPIGYQTNTYVYGVGGYRFTDFVRVGLPLNVGYFVVSVLLIPRLWAF